MLEYIILYMVIDSITLIHLNGSVGHKLIITFDFDK